MSKNDTEPSPPSTETLPLNEIKSKIGAKEGKANTETASVCVKKNIDGPRKSEEHVRYLIFFVVLTLSSCAIERVLVYRTARMHTRESASHRIVRHERTVCAPSVHGPTTSTTATAE